MIDIFEFPSETMLQEGYKLLSNKHKCFIFSIATAKFVCVPRKGVVDEQLCFDMGYMVKEYLYDGGVIVVEKGDVDIAHFGKLNNTVRDCLGNAFLKWLSEKGLNAKRENNDILVDGYKVFGMGGRRHGEIDYTVIHIGINTNLENIKKICTKKMEKVPKGLGEYGITAEEVREWFLKFCGSGTYPQGWEAKK
ncbi:MAG: hypothetical protein E7482_00420 [Ruminococcaceae bacterium]|nr:hypothetical protein [Oscillospiraceae bacterium]